MLNHSVFSYITHAITIFIALSMLFKSRRIKIVFYLFIAFVPAIIGVSIVLPDYWTYSRLFNQIQIEGFRHLFFRVEPLYLLIMSFFRLFTNDFIYFHLFLIIIPLIIKLFFLIRIDNLFIVSFVFYISLIYYPDSYLLRSTFASSLVLIGLTTLIYKKPSYLFFVSIIGASLVHISSLIILPLWFFRKTSITKSKAFMILFLIIFIGSFGVGHILANIITINFSHNFYIVDKIYDYSGSIYGERSGIIRGSVLLYLTITIIFILLKDKISNFQPHYSFLLIVNLFTLFLLIGFSDYLILADRIYRLTAIFIPIQLSYILLCFNFKHRQILTLLVLTVLNIVPYVIFPNKFILIPK